MTLTTDQRVSIQNGIWLCQSCAALVDRDTNRFSVSVLHSWKDTAEAAASKAICAGSGYRPIAANEVRQELTIAELAAIRALSDEFGCHIETEVQVPAGDGWLRLQGAVIRGEDLIAIDIRENHGKGIAYFQIEYLLDLCAKLSFQRFQRCVVYLAVVGWSGGVRRCHPNAARGLSRDDISGDAHPGVSPQCPEGEVWV